MPDETEHDFHTRRARDELDLAYRSDCYAAMASHLRLSALHMKCLGEPVGAASAVTPLKWHLPKLVPGVGLEPTTYRLQGGCSTS